MSSNAFRHRNFPQKNIFAQFQVQELTKIIRTRVKINDLNIRIFTNFFQISNQGIFAEIYINRLLHTYDNFTCLKPAKTTLFDWTTPRKFLIFIIRFSWREDQVSGTLLKLSSVVKFGQILPFRSTLFGLFFADFHWYQGSTNGIHWVCTYAYFYWHTHDFGHEYVDKYAHLFLVVFQSFQNFLILYCLETYCYVILLENNEKAIMCTIAGSSGR